MAEIREFRGVRPEKDIVEQAVELPYDVVSTAEAAGAAEGKPFSFFRITRSEIEFSADTDPYSPEVYKRGRANLDKFISEGKFFQDDEPSIYLYTQIMEGRSQTGIAACVSIDDYLSGKIKKHELTREDKEKDRSTHLDILNCNVEPVFLMYKESGAGRELFELSLKHDPEYHFTTPDGIEHIFRIIKDKEIIKRFKALLEPEDLYIADGHHRAASAARVGLSRREKNPGYTGEEEFNYFLAVIFPHDQLKIFPYNRVVKDLNGMSESEYISALSGKFSVEKTPVKEPGAGSEICMYLNREWYLLKPLFSVPDHPIEGLDVRILQDNILSPVLGITDPRTDKRIDFIGGIRGTAELEKLVDSGESAAAFSMYATTIEQLIRVSDTGGIMPPKSTWFEPKLRSGFVMHLL